MGDASRRRNARRGERAVKTEGESGEIDRRVMEFPRVGEEEGVGRSWLDFREISEESKLLVLLFCHRKALSSNCISSYREVCRI